MPLFREHVFGQIKPTTNTRIDIGLAAGAMPETKITGHKGRIIATGGREEGSHHAPHRIAVASVDEIDDLIVKWVRAAYELDGPKKK